MSDSNQSASWTQQPERGSMFLLRLMAWIGLRLGRRVARLVLYPICLYFLLFSPRAQRASRIYLGRALGRPATWRDVFRHIHTFASTILDRIYLLNDRHDLFDLRIHQEELVRQTSANGEGRLMLGAHMGSFESVRATGHRNPDAPPVALLMYEANAQKLSQLMTAINPAASQEIIALGELNAMLQVQTRLDQGAFIGMLADRSFLNDEVTWLPFLGQPAPFPIGAFRLAALLRRPLLLMLGIYRGGRQYDIHFELLFDFSQPGLQRGEAVQQALAQYVTRLEHYCRAYPYNWFNFYDFWKIPTMRLTKRALWLLIALAWCGLAQAQTAFNLDSLLALMSVQKRVVNTFTEKKFIKGLDAPIESSGELGFEAPSRMVKRTLLPKPETLSLDDRMATVERGRHVRTLSLDDYPELAVHIEGIRACLAGDRAALDRLYRVELSGSAAQWKMTLIPLNEKAAEHVLAIHLGGEQADVRKVQVLLTDGDSSIMTISRPHSR